MEATEPKLKMGQKIRELREGLGLSQANLAARVGVHLNAVGLWERGVCDPKGQTIRSIADALEVDPGELFP